MHKVETIQKSHDRKAFDCELHKELNDYIQKQAYQQSRKGVSRTFVLVDDQEPVRIKGYFTLSLVQGESKRLPDKYAKKYPLQIAGVKLARLAVDKDFQGSGLGSTLLVESMRKAYVISENAGVIGLFVDAKDDRAKSFYKHFGFEEFEDNPMELFLPLGSVKALIG